MDSKSFLKLSNGGKMPVLGYGTWNAKDDSLEKALEVALETGYRHIDTAQAYQNEEVIGNVLKRWFDSGRLKREDIFITTKLSPFGTKLDKIEESTIESLRKLQLDYVDLYLVHFPFAMVPDGDEMVGDTSIHYLDIWKKMEEQFDAGRTKSIGISNFNARQVEHLLKNCRVKPVNNQIQMHVYWQQKDTVDCCKKNDITVVAYSPLGVGSSNDIGVAFPLVRRRNPLLNEVVASIAKKHSKTPAQILIRFLLQLGVSTIPKSVTPQRIKENFDVFGFSLDDEDLIQLRGIDEGVTGKLFDMPTWQRLTEHPEYTF